LALGALVLLGGSGEVDLGDLEVLGSLGCLVFVVGRGLLKVNVARLLLFEPTVSLFLSRRFLH
jgi:hypothetical protein